MMRASLPGSAMRSALYLILLVFSIFYLVPLYVMLVNSFKELDEIRSGAMLALPDNFTLAPWESAWSTAQIGVSPTGLKPYFINSIAMVIPAVLISTLIGAINGYVLSKWQFRGHRWVFGLLLFSCFIPFQIVLIPMAKTLGILGIAGSTPGLVLVHVVYGIGFSTLFFSQLLRSVSNGINSRSTTRWCGIFYDFCPYSLAIEWTNYRGLHHLAVYEYLE